MFVGHYAVSLALKGAEKKASLGMLFLAVQFIDILFFPLVLLGIERLNIVENYTEASHFELAYMPFTHSLVAASLWAVVVYAIYRWVLRKPGGNAVALVMGVAVLSHWFLDLIVHVPDLPLLGDDTPKLGFGLWNHAVATYGLEAVLLAGGLWWYLRSTRGTSALGKYGMVGFVLFLLAVNAFNLFGPPPEAGIPALAVTALVAYFLFAGIAFWLDARRA
jgi:hypothetical protein